LTFLLNGRPKADDALTPKQKGSDGMPRPDKDLPAAALDHMPAQVIDNLPDHIAPQPEFDGNIIWDNPFERNFLFGTDGVSDIFVFDVGLNPIPHNPIDLIDSFEPDLDVIAYVNVPGEYVLESFSGDGSAQIKAPDGSGIVNDPAVSDGSTDIYDFPEGAEWSFQVGVVDAGGTPFVSASADYSVTFPDGAVFDLAAPPVWDLV
jgi:hypothetical protein